MDIKFINLWSRFNLMTHIFFFSFVFAPFHPISIPVVVFHLHSPIHTADIIGHLLHVKPSVAP